MNCSDHTFTKAVWRKAVLDLFTDSAFFRMPPNANVYWLRIIDNVVANDKPTFKVSVV